MSRLNYDIFRTKLLAGLGLIACTRDFGTYRINEKQGVPAMSHQHIHYSCTQIKLYIFVAKPY